MKKEFGNFGGKHLDHNDSEGGYTSMITCADVAEGEEPGVFMIGDLGVAISMSFSLTHPRECDLTWDRSRRLDRDQLLRPSIPWRISSNRGPWPDSQALVVPVYSSLLPASTDVGQ